MPLCRCPHCLKKVSDDKSVSKSTFHHHAKKFSRINTPFSKICHCSQHPTGCCFWTRTAYYQHCQSYQDKEILDTLNSDICYDYSPATSSPPFSASDSDDRRNGISQPIDSDNDDNNNDGSDNGNNDNNDDDDDVYSVWDDFGFLSNDQSLDIGISGML